MAVPATLLKGEVFDVTIYDECTDHEPWRVVQGPNYNDITILGPSDIELEIFGSLENSYTVEDLVSVAQRICEVLEDNWKE